MSSSPTIAERGLALRPARRLTRAALAALLVSACPLAVGEASAAPATVHAQGRVLGPEGTGRSGWPVELIATQRFIELSHFKSGGEVAVLGRTTTDPQGYFSFSIERPRGYHFWFLRFSGSAVEDPVVWQVPPDIEITRDAKRGRAADVQVQLLYHADWPEVERRIAAEGGPATERGRILRTLGLPEKFGRDPVSGAEEWWYFTRGIMYAFGGGGAAAMHRFEPVTPPGAVQARKDP